MTSDFERYGDILLDAFQNSSRSSDLVAKKKLILDELLNYFDLTISSILFVGFSPSLLDLDHRDIYVTEISPAVRQYLQDRKIKFTYIDRERIQNKFTVVVAMDEYLTFAESDHYQKAQVEWLSSITDGFVITTLRDYKNQDFKDREFSQPIIIRNTDSKRIYFEHYEYDPQDRNASLGTSYCVDDDSVMVIGPFARRNMFFKQLAKFSLDTGARNFLVHKNLMHKSVIKKNYEHIITIRF